MPSLSPDVSKTFTGELFNLIHGMICIPRDTGDFRCRTVKGFDRAC
jgi:hypothetical protein